MRINRHLHYFSLFEEIGLCIQEVVPEAAFTAVLRNFDYKYRIQVWLLSFMRHLFISVLIHEGIKIETIMMEKSTNVDIGLKSQCLTRNPPLLTSAQFSDQGRYNF